MDFKHHVQRAHSKLITRNVLVGALVVFAVVFFFCSALLLGVNDLHVEVHPAVSQLTSTYAPSSRSTYAPSPTATPTSAPTTTQAFPTSTETAPPVTGVPSELDRWSTFTIPANWMECIRRNLQLDERGRPLHAVTEMTDAIPLLITPLTGDARFFPYFICSVDVPVRYHLVIQNERDPETVATIDELQRRFGDSGRLLVIRNRFNRGYSGSMNQGFEWALKERTMTEVPWVFACGVDTIFEQGLLASLVKVVKDNTLNDTAMMRMLQKEVEMEEKLVREGNFSYYERWAPRGRPLKVLRSGYPGVPLNVWTAPLLPDRVRYMVASENRANGSFNAVEMKSRFFGNYVASVTPVASALGTIAFTRLALSTVGYFDENYFPAYMDDIDLRWRQFAYGFAAIHAEDNGPVRRWHHYNAPNLRGGGPFSDPILEKSGTEDNYSRRAFVHYLGRAGGLYDKLKHGPRDVTGVWRESVENGTYSYTRFNISGYPADTWVLDETVRECMFRHTYDYVTRKWTRPKDCWYRPNTLADSGVLGEDQLTSYQAVLRADHPSPNVRTSAAFEQAHVDGEEPLTSIEVKQRPETPAEEPHEEDAADHSDPPPPFFSWRNAPLIAVPGIGGTLNGCAIGFIGAYAQMYIMGTDCSLYRGGRTACETLPYSDCKWFDDDAGGYCGWYTITCRKQYAWGNSSADFIPETVARSACLADKRCTWSYSDQQCENPAGLTTGNHGLFAGSQVVGSCIGAFLASMLVPRIGSRISFVIIGMMQFMCCVMKYVSCAEDEFWVLIPARFVIGLSLGLTSVACPLYVDQNAHPAHKRQLGSLYQTFTSVGQLIEATMALGVGQSIWVDTNKDQHVMGRIQSLVGCLMVISIFMICLGIFSKETRAKFNNEKAEDAVQLNANEFSYRKMLPRLMMGTVIACTLQMTGINAINNFAPTIMGNLGVAPLVGNFIVIAWNLVTAIASFPLVSRFSMRRLFLTGALFISCMCMFLCGIPVYPGVTKSTPAKHGVAIAGILLFVMGYELAVAPCYFVLTQDLFPPSFRPRGASWTQVSMYIFNVIINVCFPIAVEDLSGGPSGNQDKGESIVFMFFGGIGLICLVLEYCFLHPWEDGPAGTLPAPEKSESHKTPPHADNEPHTIELDVYHDSNNSSR